VLSNEAKKIREFWKPGNEINRGNEKHIRKALKTAGIEESSISYFLYHPVHKDGHKKILEILKLTGED
jgi:hypothetical protein